MAIRVAPGTLRRMQDLRDQCLLRIAEAAEPEAARATLARLDDIAVQGASEGHGVTFVSEVMDTPDGPMVEIDAKRLTDSELRQILDALVDAAGELGLTSGTLEVPTAGRLPEDLGQVRLAVVGSVLPPPDRATMRPPEALPGAWSEVAIRWLRQAAFEPLIVQVAAVEAEISWSSLERYLYTSLRGEGFGFRVSCGSVTTGLRTVVGKSQVHTRLAFMATGLSWSADQLGSEADDIRDHVRLCASEAAYAYVTPVSRVVYFGMGEYDVPGPPSAYPGGRSRHLEDLSDVIALDAFWYQLLGPGHLERTGPIPDAVRFANGKAELTLGQFDDWVDEERRAEPARAAAALPKGVHLRSMANQSSIPEPEVGPLRRHGRTILGRCFLSPEEARTLRRERLR